MFAEDRDLLPKDLFISLVRECLDRTRQGKPSNTYDILGNLFQEMNRPGITPAGRYQGVDYFNGGLFREVQPLELTQKELELLEAAASQDWKAVRPSIFGNIFESAIGKSNSTERHAAILSMAKGCSSPGNAGIVRTSERAKRARTVERTGVV